MADPLTFLIVLSGAMFMGSYLAGSVPLLFNMSESRMRMISIFGAGLLVGTALSVIIPEGVEALYASASQDAPHSHLESHPEHTHEAVSILDANNNGHNVDNPPRIIPKNAELNEGINADASENRAKRAADSVKENPRLRKLLEEEHSEGEFEHGHAHKHGNLHSKIGYSLVVGFVFMLLVDQISSLTVSRNDRSGRHRLSISATIGLVVHAAADGIALGSASSINKSDVQLIVFVAIMLHKAPASFGLVSFLLMESLDKRSIRKHLLVFSMAAPVGAIVTFFVIGSLGDTMAASESSTGVLMLFSAGTFLYVSTVHVLPELANNSRQHNGGHELLVDAMSPSTVGHSHSHGGASFTMKELGAIICGALVPAILASGHSH